MSRRAQILDTDLLMIWSSNGGNAWPAYRYTLLYRSDSVWVDGA